MPWLRLLLLMMLCTPLHEGCAAPVADLEGDQNKSDELDLVLMPLSGEELERFTLVRSVQELRSGSASLASASDIGGNRQALVPLLAVPVFYYVGGAVLVVASAVAAHQLMGSTSGYLEAPDLGSDDALTALRMSRVSALLIASKVGLRPHELSDPDVVQHSQASAEELVRSERLKLVSASDAPAQYIVGLKAGADMHVVQQRLLDLYGVQATQAFRVATRAFATQTIERDVAQRVSEDEEVAWVEVDQLALPRLLPLGIGRLFSGALSRSRARSDEATEECRPEGSLDGDGQPISNPNGPPWHLDRIDQRRRPLDCRFEPAGTGRGVTIYVLDEAIQDHSDLAGRVVEHNLITNGPTPTDRATHGTMVASAAAGSVFGVAREAQVVSVATFTGRRINRLGMLQGVEWIASVLPARLGPAVVNMSFSYGALSMAEIDASANLVARGAVVIKSAGNTFRQGDEADAIKLASTLHVGAVDAHDKLWRDRRDLDVGTTFGPYVGIYAPGTGLPIATYLPTGAEAFDIVSGTSFASAIVSGAAAIYLEHHPQAKPGQTIKALIRASTKNVLGGAFGEEWMPFDHNRLLYVGPELTSRSWF